MIVKIVHKNKVKPGEYFHEMLVEADRIEIAYHKDQPEDGGADWSYTDQPVHPPGPRPVYIIRCWTRPNSYEQGYVRGGRIFLVNNQGKTIDRYTL